MSFSAKIVSDSINLLDNRVTTFVLTYPRFIHSEIMTHRALSRNAASSRAIPIEKVIRQVQDNPAMPIRWGKNGKGMQDHGAFSEQDAIKTKEIWRECSDRAVLCANKLHETGLHKQIVNRVLEPFVWMTSLVTATEWKNFFSLRLHKDAQPEFQYLAFLMLKEYLNNSPLLKHWGEYHIPFGDRMPEGTSLADQIKIATARAARVSYQTMDGNIDVQKDISLHDSLASSGHWSPFEHACYASEQGTGNFIGWHQYRHTFEYENRQCNLHTLFQEASLWFS